jgi:hypothetical protein
MSIHIRFVEDIWVILQYSIMELLKGIMLQMNEILRISLDNNAATFHQLHSTEPYFE